VVKIEEASLLDSDSSSLPFLRFRMCCAGADQSSRVQGKEGSAYIGILHHVDSHDGCTHVSSDCTGRHSFREVSSSILSSNSFFYEQYDFNLKKIISDLYNEGLIVD
jgi:hypothetical protein